MTAGSLTGAHGPGSDDQPDEPPPTTPTPVPATAPVSAARPPATRPAPRPKARRRRRPVRRTLIVTHRWLSLILGLVLVLITTSGAILVYAPEIQRWLNSEAYTAAGGPATVTLGQAQATVAQAHPDFAPTAVIAENGVLRVTDFERSFTVDPATGALLGEVAPEPTWLAWTANLHECLLTCENEPGYVEALTAEVPGTGWLGYEGAPITVGALILGLLGLVLLFLAVSGLWLWWPRPSRLKASLTVRRGKGRFARDTDLHKVIGMISLPLLLIWGLTGAGFELTPLETVWNALTPGTPVEAPEVVSAEGEGADVGVDAAANAALALVPAAGLAAVVLPDADDPTATYTVWLADGIDPYELTDFPGDLSVAVDRRTAQATLTSGGPDEPLSQHLWQMWNFPVHAGFVVNGWWRSIWLVLGLAPLALAVTGVSTWLVRRRTRRNRKARA
ncbi:MAG: PepSY-associated TM helix domain-containing protein [Nakamurella multipartita]